MKWIITTIFSCLVFIILINIILGFATRAQPTVQPLTIVDTGIKKTNVIDVSEARQAIYGTAALAHTNKPKLIFMGASTVRAGFRPDDWNNLTKNLETHNFAVGSASFLALLELWPHIQNAIPKSVAKQSTVVIGLVYGMTSDNLTDYIGREDSRLNPLYYSGIKWWGTQSVWNFIKLQSYRYFGLDAYLQKECRKFFSYLDSNLQKRNFLTKKAQENPSNHEALLARWAEIMKNSHIQNKHFAQISTLIKTIRKAGFKVAIVSMPLPSWHREQSPFDKLFCDRLALLMSSLTNEDKEIYFVDLHKNNKDEDFRDSAHLTRPGAKLLSLQLYHELIHQKNL